MMMCLVVLMFFLSIRRPPKSTRTAKLYPHPTLSRSSVPVKRKTGVTSFTRQRGSFGIGRTGKGERAARSGGGGLAICEQRFQILLQYLAIGVARQIGRAHV